MKLTKEQKKMLVYISKNEPGTDSQREIARKVGVNHHQKVAAALFGLWKAGVLVIKEKT